MKKYGKLSLSCPSLILTWKPVNGSLANIADVADPDQMPHNVTFDQGLHSVLTRFSIKKI